VEQPEKPALLQAFPCRKPLVMDDYVTAMAIKVGKDAKLNKGL
jgi:hypothetical protein